MNQIVCMLVIISLQIAVAYWRIIREMTKHSRYLEFLRPNDLVKGHELILIKRINRYGDVKEIDSDDYHSCKDDNFKLSCLSISEGTYIAHGFLTFIVKLKK
jgi:hypothetical protein